MGSIQKRIYLVEHPQGLDPLRNVRGLLRTQAATLNIHTQDIGWGGKNTRSSYADIPHLQTMGANKRQLEDKTEEYGISQHRVFIQLLF